MSDSAATPPPTKRPRGRGLLLGSLALPALAGSAALALWWILSTASGSAWLLRQLPGLKVEQPSGALLGDFGAQRLSWQGAGLQIELHGLRWQGLSLGWDASPLLWGRLDAQRLEADRVSISWPDTPPSDTPAPQDLTLPLALKINRLRVGELQLPRLGETPLRELAGSLDLGADAGRQHRLQLQGLSWDHWHLSGQASMTSQGDMTLQAQLLARRSTAQAAQAAHPADDWQADLQLQGPLLGPQLAAQIRGAGQRLQAQAELRPLAAWPLASAELSAERFDLAALYSALPATALSGRARLQTSAWDKPAELKAELGNSLAGRWDQGRLPLRQLKLDLQARPDQISDLAQLRVITLDALLGSAAEPAGRLSAQGSGLALSARLSELRSAALDARLPRLRLDGTLTLQGQAGQGQALPALQLATALQGEWDSAQGLRPVQLRLKGHSQGRRFELEQARLSAGSSTLQARGQLLRPEATAGAATGWQASLEAAAERFDPRLLWAGAAGSAWQRGSHQLSATLKAELSQPSSNWPGWPQGQARLQLAPSQINGMPLSGAIDYQAASGSAPALAGALMLASNQLKLSARASAQAELDIEAGKLAELRPLLALWAPQAQLGGSLRGHLELRAHDDPTQALLARAWSSTGQLSSQALQLKGLPELASLRLGNAALDWSADTRLDAPLRLSASAQQLALPAGLVSSANLMLDGSWASHRVKLNAQGAASLPSWAALLAGQEASSLRAALQFDARLANSPWLAWRDGLALDWQARGASLLLRPAKPDLPAWLDAGPLAFDVRLNARSGLLQQATLAPGRAELAGAALRWRQLQWQAAARPPAPGMLLADLELEPLAVAPLLARWQPSFGWGGDLVMGGRARLRSAPEVEIDIALERAGGDLSVTDDAGVQALGLSELRLALLAQRGTWHLTQAVAGHNLGVLGGALSSRTDPAALWPAPDAPLEGVLSLQVANLGNWGAWLPPGWRLGGQTMASISLGGRVDAPEIKGLAEGSQIALRNPLLGVDVSEGSFALRLDGATATLERLSARGGAGQLSAKGQAELGATPKASLELQAERFTLLSRVDRRLVSSGQARLDLSENALKLDGRFNIDEGLFDFTRADAPSLDEDVRVRRPHSVAAEAPPPARTSERRIDLRLALTLGQQLRVQGRGLDTRLRGELMLSHAKGRPALNGVVQTAGGSYEAYGQKLEIEKGEISFTGALDNPRLDVLAVRPNTEVRVGVTLGGTAMNPRIKLYAEPEMSETDKLSWLVLGRGPDTLGRADSALLQRAALALLAGEGESPSGRLMKNLGLDEISVGQDADEARGTVVRVGKQISSRWYLGYERSLNATTGSWQLIYRIARRFTLRAQSGDENALDLIWQWRWR